MDRVQVRSVVDEAKLTPPEKMAVPHLLFAAGTKTQNRHGPCCF